MTFNVNMAVPETLIDILSKHGFDYDNQQDFVEWLNSIPSDLTETVNVHDLTEDTARALVQTTEQAAEVTTNKLCKTFSIALIGGLAFGAAAIYGYEYWKQHKAKKVAEITAKEE